MKNQTNITATTDSIGRVTFSQPVNTIEMIKQIGENHIEELVEQEMKRIDQIIAVYDELKSNYESFVAGMEWIEKNRVEGCFAQRTILWLLGAKETAYDFTQKNIMRMTYSLCGSHGKYQRMQNFIWDICGTNRETQRAEYLKMFKMGAWAKLENAIDKFIKPTDVSLWGYCQLGSKGLEIWADVNGSHVFDTKCIMAGGYIQSLHYRYLAHLKTRK